LGGEEKRKINKKLNDLTMVRLSIACSMLQLWHKLYHKFGQILMSQMQEFFISTFVGNASCDLQESGEATLHP